MPSVVGIGLVRHDWRPIFELCREIQAGFKSGVRYPSRAEQQRAWELFSELNARVRETSTREREALSHRSKDHLDNLLYQCRGITYSPITDVVFFFDKTTADEVRSWGSALREVIRTFGECKHEMTREHKQIMSERIQQIKESHALFWGHYKEAHERTREQRRKEFEARTAERARKQREWELRQKEREQKQKEFEARKADRERKQREWEARQREREQKQKEWEARKREREQKQREWEARKAEQQREWESRQREREQKKKEWEERRAESERRKAEWEERKRNRGGGGGGRRGGGSRGTGGGCFITTAVCRSVGLDDDCALLDAFRDFRDHWLAKQEVGPRLIERYYEIAPRIVHIIDTRPDATDQYKRLWTDHLATIYLLIEAGCREQALTHYSAMVAEVEASFLEGDSERNAPRVCQEEGASRSP